MKHLLIGVLAILSFLLSVSPGNAEEVVNLYLFYGEGCSHCGAERQFLSGIAEKYPNTKLREFEIYYNPRNSMLLKEAAEILGAEVGGVPFLVIGDTTYVGFARGYNDRQIEERVKECSEEICPDSIATLIGADTHIAVPEEADPKKTPPIIKNETDEAESEYKKELKLPIFGTINPEKLSLPLLTLVVAGLDGFNPCAMWTLLFLISLLLSMEDRKRMWILGTVFIATSAFAYFLFLSAWLNLFLFIGFVVWVRAVVGAVAIAAGAYYLRDYIVNKSGGCGVMGDERRQRVFEKLKTVTQKRRFFLALIGIIALAMAVNMVELICSAGLPAIYTQILSMSALPAWQYYLYLIFYVLIFMLDDLFVFFTAMITLRAVGVQSKYARYSHLIGGGLMLGIGVLLLLKPEWLMFG